MARVLLATLLLALAVPAAAAAHGDASSHYLETQALYPASTNQASPAVELQLLGFLDAVEAKGYPMKVALLGSVNDIPDEPQMLRAPQRYAERLGRQLERADVLTAPVVVVTPYGLGVSGRAMVRDRFGPVSRKGARALVGGIDVGRPPSGDELARAAIAATRRIAAAGGHPLPAHVPPAKVPTPPSLDPPGQGSGVWAAAAVFAAIFGAAVAFYEVLARRSLRRRRLVRGDLALGADNREQA
jgi:hypothetical protein